MIDEPTKIAIRQAREELVEEESLPKRLVTLGLSAVIAHQFAQLPFFSQILTSLLTGGSKRLEERLLCVAEELEAQQTRLEERIADRSYYESDEFYTLFGLILERLHTTHDQEKLKRFGDALANSASIEYSSDEKEIFIRILRDLSADDLKTLNHDNLKGWLPTIHRMEYGPEVLSSLSRLAGMGLVTERFHIPSPRATGSQNLDAKLYLEEVLGKPPRRAFHISPFGERFLKFIADSNQNENGRHFPGGAREEA